MKETQGRGDTKTRGLAGLTASPCLPVSVSALVVELRGIEPLHPACRAGIIPLDHSPE